MDVLAKHQRLVKRAGGPKVFLPLIQDKAMADILEAQVSGDTGDLTRAHESLRRSEWEMKQLWAKQ